MYDAVYQAALMEGANSSSSEKWISAAFDVAQAELNATLASRDIAA
ncbi:MAG: hypothetical protein IPK53_03235 [bacterium]|nr:hypothetical protein [bacterium]